MRKGYLHQILRKGKWMLLCLEIFKVKWGLLLTKQKGNCSSFFFEKSYNKSLMNNKKMTRKRKEKNSLLKLFLAKYFSIVWPTIKALLNWNRTKYSMFLILQHINIKKKWLRFSFHPLLKFKHLITYKKF